ncbi:acyl-coa n-acyltransferase [Lucifera butyrica]|uniref:Acyl-coa n-acyltransferase n=1 Tax=Lucifera butyrica TaxID=1351585 RepID=A0A498RFN8_9FIRM|nr:cyclic nucleotide-binding domain-containing protein [Lucifera butyrica]VBB09767.1 acyl-coa n-acyltransferase [Lucifera butyrica]
MKSIVTLASFAKNKEPIKIGIATTPEEKREIYRFRYTIYADEVAFNLISVDRKNKLLYDQMDEWAILFYAQVGSTLIATARTNIGKLTDFPPDVVQIYQMDKFKTFYDKKDDPNFAVISKGMIASEYRSSPILKFFMASHYELYCNYQVQFAFINCNFHLIPLYEYFGNQRLDNNSLDPNLGPQNNFVMVVDDIQYLRAVGSPLFPIASRRASQNSKAVDWFNSEFSAEIKATVNSQITSPDTLWSIISQYLGDIPNKVIAPLKDLSVPEAKLFLHSCGIIVHCHAGDYITMGSNASQELIILLSGMAQSSLQGRIWPGQVCGANGLENRTTHPSSVVAVSDANILVLSYHYFKKFRKSYPDIAYKILKNLHEEDVSQ